MWGKTKRLLEIFFISTRLGLTSFGGPTAHLGFFHEEYIRRRKWIDDQSYADIVALCQFLPGPASSQVGISLGMIRGGILGAFIAWFGFTIPSVIALIVFALFVQGIDIANAGWLHGLKIVAVVIVAHAVLGMGKTLAPDAKRATIAIGAAIASLLFPSAVTQIILILTAGLIGLMLFKTEQSLNVHYLSVPVKRSIAILSLILFFFLLILFPILTKVTPSSSISLFDSFYRVGSLVFGGGHVVLPLLEREVIPTGLINRDQFIAGYGAAQAVPGPLFTFAAYLGAVMGGWKWAILSTMAIFLPSFLLVTGVLPYWDSLRQKPTVQSALKGINAAVVGILLAALYNPLWITGIQSTFDFCLGLVLFCLLAFWKLPSWIIVVVGLLGGNLFL